MAIDLFLYNDDAIERVTEKTKDFFRKKGLTIYNENLMTLDNMYIIFRKSTIIIKVDKFNFMTQSNLVEYIYNVFRDEEVGISDTNFTKHKYFNTIQNKSEIKQLGLRKMMRH
jgi:hypothetical protein